MPRHTGRTALLLALAVSACSGGKHGTDPTPTNTEYTIDLRWVGTPPSAAIQSAFTNAVTRWQQVVTGDIPNVQTDTFARAGSCGEPSFPDTRNTAIDDILIYAEVKPIDGAGQVLGQSKPCFTNSNKTVIGYMKFDSADLQTMVSNGTLNDVILHEVGHVIGLGTLWNGKLTTTDTLTSADPRWTGNYGNGSYTAVGGTGGAPVENCAQGVPSTCGVGTRLAHWREYDFANELMTGYISASGNPLSRVTIGALRDLGYTVSNEAADVYVLPAARASFSGSVAGVQLHETAYTGPIVEIGRR